LGGKAQIARKRVNDKEIWESGYTGCGHGGGTFSDRRKGSNGKKRKLKTQITRGKENMRVENMEIGT